jgi:glycosyltransferase involved in cell wall biosynthesis
MKRPIYLEVNPFLQQGMTGVGRFVARLVEQLVRHVPLRLVTTIKRERADQQKLLKELVCGYEIAVDGSNVPSDAGDVMNWRRALLKLPRRWHDPRFARQCAGIYSFGRPGVRHFGREVGILYDFTPQIVPWTHTSDMRAEFSGFARDGCRLFEKALAISESTKADATWLSRMSERDIAVAYPGPSQCLSGHDYDAAVSRRCDMVLAVSTLEPRKNPQFLVDWFLNTPVLPAQMELCWAGPKGWIFDLSRLRRSSAGGRQIRFLGMVSDAELCKLFRQATFAVYPSLYEGFGYPVLDSLLHGTPVLSSFHSSLQEFAGPGLYFFDPYDPSSLDAAYGEMASAAGGEVNRPDLRRKCSWENVAQTVLDLCA